MMSPPKSPLKRFEVFFAFEGRRTHVTKRARTAEQADERVRYEWRLPPYVQTEVKCRSGEFSKLPWDRHVFGAAAPPVDKAEGPLFAAARRLLNWTKEELRVRTGLAYEQIRDLEEGRGPAIVRDAVAATYAARGLDLRKLAEILQDLKQKEPGEASAVRTDASAHVHGESSCDAAERLAASE